MLFVDYPQTRKKKKKFAQYSSLPNLSTMQIFLLLLLLFFFKKGTRAW